jgi:hypothetical protein
LKTFKISAPLGGYQRKILNFVCLKSYASLGAS